MTRYELLDRIGVGGMAEIFRGKAVAAGGFEKPVAIKRILPHLSQDPRFVELLIAEAKVLSLLKHRNITQIFDVGLGDDQQYFLVMEYVDGKDLGAIVRALEVRRKKIPFDLALHIVAEICEALEHAHSARAPDGKAMSLVHRDISPSNVLLSRAGEVKLTDFGIAKRAEQEQTRGGAVKGKFAYISPEQARNEHLDPRSDVFSVGILLWELTTNRALFSKLPDLEALRGVREPAKIPLPSSVDPTLTRELDALVMGALSPESARRPTAGMLGAKIRSLRYSLEETVGDPATELAKLIEAAEQEARKSVQMMALVGDGSLIGTPPPSGGFEDGAENTVIRIRTADAFSNRDRDGTGMAQARMVIDRFEEEETRLAQLSSEQLRMLRSGAPADSGPQRPKLPKGGTKQPPARAKRPTDSDEPTTARPPLSRQMLVDESGEEATFAASPQAVHALERDIEAPRSLDSDEHTRLVAPRDRRTPMPLPRATAPSAPPPMKQPPPRPMPPPPVPQQQQQQQPPQQMFESLAPPLPNAGAWHAQTPMSTGLPPYTTPLPYGYQPQQQPPQMPMQQMMPQPPQQQQQPWGVAPMNPQRGASPTMQDAFGNPIYGAPPARPSMPQVSGFGTPKKGGLKPWMLVVGALIVAGLAFAITRGLIGGHTDVPPKPAPTTK